MFIELTPGLDVNNEVKPMKMKVTFFQLQQQKLAKISSYSQTMF